MLYFGIFNYYFGGILNFSEIWTQVQRFVEDAVAGLVKAPRLVQATSNADLDEVARLLYSGADLS